MEIRDWWRADEAERFWLEITDRTDLGADLHAPQSKHDGRETWSYSLMEHVAPGDVVLHWWKQGSVPKAIVGFSRVMAPSVEAPIRWTARGTAARGTHDESMRPGWRVALSGYTDFADPVTLGDVRAVEGELRSAHDDLLRRYGAPLYFPFAFSDKRSIRTTQGYLAKFPVAALRLFPQLGEASASGDGSTMGANAAASATGYMSDAVVRSAIERHAMNWTMDFLEAEGFLVEDVGDQGPFDVLAVSDDREIHVEVKGSSGQATTVELTAGEVGEASAFTDSLLVVVDSIRWTHMDDGSVTTTGGRPRLWWNWAPAADRLVPTSFRYLLPPADI